MSFFKKPSPQPQSVQEEPSSLSVWPLLQDRRFQFGVYALITLIHLSLVSAPLVRRLESVFLDAFFRARPALETSPQIAFVEIAQDSIEKIGRWPWPRRYHAALLGILQEWQARAVVFDAFFSEPSPDAFDDNAFAEALGKMDHDYAGVVIEDSAAGGKVWTHSIPALESKMSGVGHVNVKPDEDGVTRRVALEITQNGEKYRYLGMEVAEDFLETLHGVKRRYPLAADGTMLINWADRWEKTFHHYSYFDLLQSYAAVQKGEKPLIKPEDIQGKIVLVGLTAAGLTDIKGVPVQAIFPGVGVIANVMNSIITGKFVSEAKAAENRAALVLLALISGIWFWNSGKINAWLTAFLFAGGWVALAFLIFVKAGIFFQVVNPILLIFNFFIFSVFSGFLKSQSERSVLYQLATRDGLTGLYVIRHMRSLLEQARQWGLKRGHPVSVVMSDIDFFKKINDGFGHDAGDLILKDVARLMELELTERNHAGKRIKVGRYGGEEFIILIESCDAATAKTYAEFVRKKVESFQFNYHGKQIPVTLSLGVGQMRREDSSPDDAIRRADEALYRAKHSGRNRVEVELPA